MTSLSYADGLRAFAITDSLLCFRQGLWEAPTAHIVVERDGQGWHTTSLAEPLQIRSTRDTSSGRWPLSMGYTGVYSLGSRCISEFFATCLTIYLGESVLANAELPKTKGHGFSFGFVSLGFAGAFFLPLLTFGRVSAHINPASLLCLWTIGELSAGNFFALAACEMAGGFAGAVLVWLHFLPHFKTVPEPPAEDPADAIVRTRDYMAVNARQLASYDTRRPGEKMTVKQYLTGALEDVRYYLKTSGYAAERIAPEQLVEEILGKDSHDIEGKLRRRSIQVCDIHNKLKHIDVDRMMREMHSLPGEATKAFDAGQPNITSIEDSKLQEPLLLTSNSSAYDIKLAELALDRKRLDAAYEAAIIIDQNAKLSVFATRPAVYAPIFNFTVEFLSTTVLISGAELISFQGRFLPAPLNQLWPSTYAFYVFWFIFVIICGLGGPTGVALNPARDLAPRFAHYLLPIPGKGSSEWDYAWVPAIAPMFGGLAGAGLFKAMVALYAGHEVPG